MSTAQQTMILSPRGGPFSSDGAARQHMRRNELPASKYSVVSHSGGWAIVRKDAPSAVGEPGTEGAGAGAGAAAESAPVVRQPISPVTYERGMFLPRTDPSQPVDVMLGWNGDVLRYKRGIQVIVPSTHLAVAADAKHDVFTQEPGKTLKRVDTVSSYPFAPSGTATREEFLTFLVAGNAQQQAGELLLKAANG